MAKSKNYVGKSHWRVELHSSTGGGPDGESPMYKWVLQKCNCEKEGSSASKKMPKGWPRGAKGGWNKDRTKYIVNTGPHGPSEVADMTAEEVCEMHCAAYPQVSLHGYPDQMANTNHIR